MKTSATVLVLLALLALIPCTQCLAQTPQMPQAAVAATPAVSSAPAVTPSLAAFLATLSGSPGNALATETVCNTNADCTPGEICCYPCGIDGCDRMCMTPWRGNRCPPIP